MRRLGLWLALLLTACHGRHLPSNAGHTPDTLTKLKLHVTFNTPMDAHILLADQRYSNLVCVTGFDKEQRTLFFLEGYVDGDLAVRSLVDFDRARCYEFAIQIPESLYRMKKGEMRGTGGVRGYRADTPDGMAEEPEIELAYKLRDVVSGNVILGADWSRRLRLECQCAG